METISSVYSSNEEKQIRTHCECVKWSERPNLRYLAGKDVETWAANKKTMSDTQFHDMMQGISH
jgi:hypothetical protein